MIGSGGPGQRQICSVLGDIWQVDLQTGRQPLLFFSALVSPAAAL